MFATRLRCVSIAPLATPVVPPVYCRKAMSLGRDVDLRQRVPAPSVERVAEADRARDVVVRHHLLDVLQHEVHDRALRERRACRPAPVVITVLDRRVGEHLLHGVREVVQHHDRAGAGIDQLVLAARAAVYIGLVLTTVRPARSTPKIAIGYCSSWAS